MPACPRLLCTRALRAFFAAALLVTWSGPLAAQPDFAQWLAALRAEALAQGISQATLDAALADVAPIERVLELDRRQPEFTQTFWTYLDRRVSDRRVERGRRMLAEHGALLAKIERQYGVQPRFLVSFWGLESNFGDHTGDFPVISALATLAYDGRRGAFFRAQLLDALKILDQGHIAPAAMSGSWAGAMGQVQFIPTTFTQHAVDADGDGRRDIWTSVPDALGSAANFLSKIGWDGKRTWGREVRLPAKFDWDMAGLDRRRRLAEWQALGVRRADGRDLPRADIEAALILPGGHKGPAFLVYDNFRVILAWNRSLLYAIAVGHLADRLAGAGALVSARPSEERALSRGEVEELQSRLLHLGYDTGEPDGVVGPQTRAALRAFQRTAGLPADGFPSFEALQELRERGDG